MQQLRRTPAAVFQPHAISRSRISRARMLVTASAQPNNRFALITGANTGIGFETAKALVSQGYFTALACRNPEKGKAAKSKLLELYPAGKVETVTVDLSDLESVRGFASKVLDAGQQIDVLINNAGVMACPYMETKQGFEYQLGVNHLGHFLLTTMLLPALVAADRPTRIVNVASSAHLFGHMDFDDLMCQKDYQPWKAYGASKLANVLFSYELARRVSPGANLTVNALHPGVVDTELARYILPGEPAFWQKPLFAVAKKFAKTPVQGAQTSIHLATSPEVAGITSKYWSDSKPVTSSQESYDAAVALKLWEVSAELTGAPAVQRVEPALAAAQ